MKRSIKYITVLLIVAFIGNSCSKDFLDVENRNRLALSSFFKTPDDALFAVNAAYYGLSGRGMFGYSWFLMFGTYSDRILFETPNADQIMINSTNGNVSMMFQDLYVGMYRTSSVINNLQNREIPGLDENLKQRYLGECYALQAAYLFHLVTIFNQPYYYDENSVPEDPNTEFPNADPITFWDKLESDLNFAVSVLPDSYPAADIGKVTKGMAYALLGKALLYKHYHYYARFGMKGSAEDRADLEKARDAFKEVMNSGLYSLVQPQEPKTKLDYEYAFLSNFSYQDLPSENNVYTSEYTTESVWMIMYLDEYTQNQYLPAWMASGSRNAEYFSAHQSSYRNWVWHPYFWNEFETTGAPAGFDRDPRAYATCYLDGDVMDFRPENKDYYPPNYFTTGINCKSSAENRDISIPNQPTREFGIKKYFFPVYYEGVAPKNSPVNRNYIRYSDVLLMYAEVMYMLGDDGTGLDALNQVRERVDMPDIASLTADAIIHERDVELAGEGWRFLDLIRWSFDDDWGIDWNNIEWGINTSNSINPFVVGKNEYLPIPIREINLGRGQLKQNPGW